MNLKSEFISQLRATFPGLKNEPLENFVSENLISPFAVTLPATVLVQAQKAVRAIFEMRERASYVEHYQELIARKGLRDPGNKSIMMSYDFHVADDGNLKLIEVNTNAAFMVLGHQMYAMKGHPLPVADFSLQEIGETILEELRLQGKAPGRDLKIVISDQAPTEQRLYTEFLAFHELFKSFGWHSRIQDYRELFQDFQPDFIYNRYTDFFLEDATSQLLREKFLSRATCLSPNPFEYLLLADKQRLIDWVEAGFLESQGVQGEDLAVLRDVLPQSYDLRPDNAEEMWAQRKKLFFKPKNAFGSKLSYRGSTVSRKAFDEALKEDLIAQEYVPAPEQSFETPTGPQKFKFDLRCYAYKGRLQFILARLYQGQVTNLRTPLGGFATVLFK